MLTKLEGKSYIELINGGIKNLDKHRTILNELNVFPVPDGDTGTNMIMTLRCGYESVKNETASLSEVAKHFSSAAVYGARGNSGVIVSQFFKGVSEGFEGVDAADAAAFSVALQNGCKRAYASVATPVEGTMLTVIKDASNAVSRALPLDSIEEAIDIFLVEARSSLDNTPELLPILKKAGVVDSGGSGIVCFFEGVQKLLKGEDIGADEAVGEGEYVDLSKINKDTLFEYGYCVEGLIQLKLDYREFDMAEFSRELTRIGESVVASLELDKIKIHVHVRKLAPLMEYCQGFGEFLTIKIDNMTVQNLQRKEREEEKEERKKFLFDSSRQASGFSVVAVATNEEMQKTLFEMGADVVILSEIAPSSQDFVDAFEYTGNDKILVFPNSSNSILAAKQGSKLYKSAKVSVLNSRCLAECYSVLSVMDFDSSLDDAVEMANQTLSDIYQLAIYHATRDRVFGKKRILNNDFFALSNNQILDVGASLGEVTTRTVCAALEKHEYSVVTLFCGKSINEENAQWLNEIIEKLGYDIELATVFTYETAYDLMITFE